MDCCAVVTNRLQEEFIYKHVEGAEAVASTGMGSVEVHDDVQCRHDDVGIGLHDKPVWLVVSHLDQACNLVFLLTGPMYL